MKRLHTRDKLKLLALAHQRATHEARRDAKKSLKRRRSKRVRKKMSKRRAPWAAPEVFALGDKSDRQLFLAALRRLRRRTLSGEKQITLDFSTTRSMHAEATLLFVAELRTLVRITEGAVEWHLIPSETNKVMQVLQQVRVLELIGVSLNIECKDEDVVHWLCAFGQGADGSKFDDVMGPYQGEIAEALNTDLYKGVSEAMTNVVNHAYLYPREDGLKPSSDRDWWMFSTQRRGRLTVVICDLGAGIPGTLPHNPYRRSLWKKIRRLPDRSDGKTIAYAVEDSVSRTKRTHRGKGLGQISRAIQHIDDAKVTIMSNRGIYQRTSSGRVKIGDYSDSILGTIIYWDIPLRQAVEP